MKPILRRFLLYFCSPAAARRRSRAGLAMSKAKTHSSPRPSRAGCTRLAVQRGQWVKRGDLLFTLDDTMSKPARDQAVASLAQDASAQRNDAHAALVLHRKS